ncbi:DNA polymerase III subunit gamma/tau [Oscillospiraceae bacterium LCP25S3_E10]|nr:DNA polymerase III subunit gamma/tau [Ruminococcus sp.]MDD6446844.1 DNA polymerase III subunit gamma/tau [Ruminococcus sp.]
MYQVLYRKWRPKVFEDVSGQPQVTTTLKNELISGRINHAYLFTGSRGTGKTTCAKILAKAVNCLNPQNGDPCGECEICRGIDDGTVLDISEIDAASNNGVDNIRAIIEEAAFAPSKAKYRVYIIDEVHMLSPGAFNALLKTLEEPPSNVVFILATTEVHKLPATILSRCQRFDFHRIAARDIADRLEYVAQQENIQLEDEAALLIASVADGALRDALSLLDRCMGVSDNITSEVVQKTAGLAGRGHLFDITRSIIDKNVKQALEITQQLYNESKDMGRLCQELLDHFRNLMLIKTMKSPESLIMLSAQEREQAKQQAQEFSLEGIVYVMDVLQKSYDRMFKGGNKRAEMELALIKLTSVQLDTSTEALMARIAKLERMVKNGVTVSPEHKAQSATAEVKEAAAPVVPKINREQLTVQTTPQAQAVASQAKTDYDYDTIVKNAVPMEDWQEVLEVLRKYSITIATSFKNTRAYISGDYILIDSQNELAFKLLKQQSQRERMREAVKEVTGRVYKLGPYKKLDQQDKQENPLDQFIKQAKESGVPVEEE